MQDTKPKISFWGVSALGLLWNLMGCLNYITQTNAQAVAQMPASYQLFILTRPTWATAGFALAVFGGAVGCILLLLRRKVAVIVLYGALAGAVLTMMHAVIATGLSADVLISTGTSVVLGLVLLWVARLARRSGWLR